MDHAQLTDNQSAHYFTVASIDFEKNYRVMDLRIQRGFSDRDLSFLLGYHPLFVRDVENPLHKKSYKAKDVNYLMHIFGCELSTILPSQLAELTYAISVITTRHKNNTRSYKIYRELSNGKKQLFKSFTELPREEVLSSKSELIYKKLKGFLLSLIEAGFFTQKTGLEVYNKCHHHFGNIIRPIDVEQAIKDINKMKGPKIKVEKNDMRRWGYIIFSYQ